MVIGIVLRAIFAQSKYPRKKPAHSVQRLAAPFAGSKLPLHFSLMDYDKDRLEEYLLLCQSIYERLERENTWPWKTDSTSGKDAVESDSNLQDL